MWEFDLKINNTKIRGYPEVNRFNRYEKKAVTIAYICII